MAMVTVGNGAEWRGRQEACGPRSPDLTLIAPMSTTNMFHVAWFGSWPLAAGSWQETFQKVAAWEITLALACSCLLLPAPAALVASAHLAFALSSAPAPPTAPIISCFASNLTRPSATLGLN
ncbi:hypothetical protein E4U53_005821, partial [Claviceps sorghi]